MNASGVFVRESVLDILDVEHLFSSPRAYQYYMNRLSGEEWKREQEKDNNDQPPVTLSSIEHGVGLNALDIMLSNENGRGDYNAMTDIRLCEFIDQELLPRYCKESVYLLSRTEKEKLGNYLCSKYRLSKGQVARCITYV